MGSYWIFGASKPLGMGIARELSNHHTVTRFSRTLNKSEVAIELSDTETTRRVIAEHFTTSRPDGAVFCQRYRASPGASTIEAIKHGIDVELSPVLTLIDNAKATPILKPLSLVLISSVAATSFHIDVPVYYHLLKSLTITATRVLAAHNLKSKIRLNCIILGEFEKYPREQYSAQEQLKYQALERFMLSNRVCDIADIIKAVMYFLSTDAKYITGQTLYLDGGMSLISPESITRVTLGQEKSSTK